jgi:hypothetical protein
MADCTRSLVALLLGVILSLTGGSALAQDGAAADDPPAAPEDPKAARPKLKRTRIKVTNIRRAGPRVKVSNLSRDRRVVLEGEYRGVAPEHPDAPPGARLPRGVPELTWPGFQELPGGNSRVFIQLTTPTTYTTRAESGRLVIRLKPARIGLRNNRRPLDTRFFDTPVRAVTARSLGGNAVDVVIELKMATTHNLRVEDRGGYTFILVDFPAIGGSRPVPTARPSGPAPTRKEAR